MPMRTSGGKKENTDLIKLICLFLFFIAFPRPSFDLFAWSTQREQLFLHQLLLCLKFVSEHGR